MVLYMENYDIKEKLIDYDELDIYSDEGGFSDVLTDAVSETTVEGGDLYQLTCDLILPRHHRLFRYSLLSAKCEDNSPFSLN